MASMESRGLPTVTTKFEGNESTKAVEAADRLTRLGEKLSKLMEPNNYVTGRSLRNVVKLIEWIWSRLTTSTRIAVRQIMKRSGKWSLIHKRVDFVGEQERELNKEAKIKRQTPKRFHQ